MRLRLLHYADVETAADDPTRLGRLAGAIAARRGPGTIVTGGGDNAGPGVLSLLTRGRHALDLAARTRPAVETVGNHDLDHGVDALLELVRGSPATWVLANATVDGESLGATAGVVPWALVDRGGARVGFTGVLEPATPRITPAAPTLTVTDPFEAARDAVGALRDRGADPVVVLSHVGDDAELAAAVDADLVLGGHVHEPLVDRIGGTLLARPGSNATELVQVRHGRGGLAAELIDVTDAPVDGGLANAVRARRRRAGLDEVVAHVVDPLDRSRGTAFGGESRLGNFVADAYRWAAGADVGLQNAGGIREGPPLSGPVTVADLIGVVPFDEPVSVGRVTGAELRTIVGQAAGVRLGYGDPDWWHAHLSGAAVTWDVDRDRVSGLTVGGRPVDPDATYTLATSDYLFFTDREFPALTPGHRTARLARQYDVVVDYARAVGIDPAIEGRIVRAAADGRGGR